MSLDWEPVFRNLFFDSFLCVVPPMPTGQAQPLQGHLLPTLKTAYPTFDTMFWDGKFVLAGLHFYKLQLVSQIVNSRYVQEGAIIVSGFGIIWHWHYSSIPTSPSTPNFATNAFFRTDFFSPDWFDFEPQPLQPAIRGRRWSDGPPPV